MARLHPRPYKLQGTRRRRLLQLALAAGTGAVAVADTSARLNYENPVQEPIQTWYNRVTPARALGSTFFATNGHSTGIMGLKQVGMPDGRYQGTAVFSISKEGHPAQLVECGSRATCSDEGVQGLNSQLEAKIAFDMTGSELPYSFLVKTSSDQPGIARYEGYVQADELGGWQLLAKIDAAIGDRAWTLEDMYSYVLQLPLPPGFAEESLSGSPPTTWGRFGPSFVEPQAKQGEWGQVASASLVFGVGSTGASPVTGMHANVTGGGLLWGLGLDGPAQVRATQGERLEVMRQPALPDSVVQFSRWITTGQQCVGSGCAALAPAASGGSGLAAWLTRVEYLVPTALLTAVGMYCFALLVVHECGGPDGLLGWCLAQSPDQVVPGGLIGGASKLRSVAHLPLGSVVEAYAGATVSVAAFVAHLAGMVLGSSSTSSRSKRYAAVVTV